MSTILLVEDHLALLLVLQEFLESDGHTVLATNSANAALRISQQFPEKIDLLVSKIMLTPLNGAELAMALRVERPTLAVILTSDTPPESFLGRFAAYAFLQKPFSRDQLLQAVTRCLRPVTIA